MNLLESVSSLLQSLISHLCLSSRTSARHDGGGIVVHVSSEPGSCSSSDMMSIVRRSDDRDGSSGSSIDVRQVVGELLNNIRRHLTLVQKDGIVARSGSSEETSVTHEIEIVIDGVDDIEIDDGSSSDVSRLVSTILGRGEEADVVSFSADNVCNRWVVRRLKELTGTLESSDLPSAHLGVLSLGYSISVEDDSFGLSLGLLEELLDQRDCHSFKVDDDLLSVVLNSDGRRVRNTVNVVSSDNRCDRG